MLKNRSSKYFFTIFSLFSAQILEAVNHNVPSKFQDHIQIGNDTLVIPDEIKGHRYQEHNSTRRSNHYRGSMQIMDSDNELENVVEVMEEGDEDITDLRRHATTPQSRQSQKDYFEKNQVGTINNCDIFLKLTNKIKR